MVAAGEDFHAPLSPTTDQFRDRYHSPLQPPCGGALAHQIADFYAWYLAWDALPRIHAQNYQYLSQIKRIAHVCMEGGLFLTEREERRALDLLNLLKWGLYDGTIPQKEIPEHLKRIISELTAANHKARLVSHTTELEYRLCIYPPKCQSFEVTAALRILLNQIIAQISPMLEERDARAIDQGIAQILNNFASVPDVQDAIKKAIQGWLS